MQYYEDIKIGDVTEFGSYLVTEKEIIDFGNKFDPQPFHTDITQSTIFGGLIASGWHTCSIFMRMFVDHYLKGGSGMPSPGVDQLSWLKPVKPGNTLHARVTIKALRKSKSKPDRAIVTHFCEVINENDEPVLTMSTNGFVPVRNQDKI